MLRETENVNVVGDELNKLFNNYYKLPDDLKKMVISKIILDPLIIFNVDCSNFKINNLICNNLELLKILWLKFISDTLPKNENGGEIGAAELELEYRKAAILYGQHIFSVLINDENKKYDILYKNFKNASVISRKLQKNQDINTKKLDKMNYYNILVLSHTQMIDRYAPRIGIYQTNMIQNKTSQSFIKII